MFPKKFSFTSDQVVGLNQLILCDSKSNNINDISIINDILNDVNSITESAFNDDELLPVTKAARLFYLIIKNSPFKHANRATAILALDTYMLMHLFNLYASDSELFILATKVQENIMNQDDVYKWLEEDHIHYTDSISLL